LWTASFEGRVKQLRIRKGQSIFVEGTPVFGVYILNSGKAKLVSSDSFGNQRIVRLAADRHILSSQYSVSQYYLYSAIALEDCTVCFFPTDAWEAALYEHQLFAKEVMGFFATQLARSEQHIKFMTLMTVEERVAFALLYATETFDRLGDDRDCSFHLTRTELAQLAGTNIQQVSRSLRAMLEEKLLEGGRNHVTLHSASGLRKRLKKYLP